MTPDHAGVVALTDHGGEATHGVQGAGPVEAGAAPSSDPVERPRVVTTTLPPLGYLPPASYEEVLLGTKSFAGFSAVSGWLNCPEAARLQSKGVREREKGEAYGPPKLAALTFGTVAHVMRAVRLIYGQEQMAGWFQNIVAPHIPEGDARKLDLMFRIYDSVYPWGRDPFELLGVEVLVVSDVAAPGEPPALRSVQYDSVIRLPDGTVLSWEAKTAARTSNMEQHNPQGMCQSALWNANPNLVAKYGQMRGTMFDEFVKTETPKVDRKEPRYYGRVQQSLALKYLRLPDVVKYPVGPDGRYPQMLHACWGKYSPCQYMTGCHEDAWNLYVYDDGEPYLGD